MTKKQTTREEQEWFKGLVDLGCIARRNIYEVYYEIHHRTGGFGVAIHAGRKAWEAKFGTESDLLVQLMHELGEVA